MRPVPKKYKMNFGYLEEYPDNLKWITKDGKHHGQDFLAPKGTSVIASVDGYMEFVGWLRGFGNCAIIRFKGNAFDIRATFRVILAHLSHIDQKLNHGLKIRKWDEIGKSGDSGYAKNHPHLHIQVEKLKNGVWVHIEPSFVTGEK